MNGNMMKWKLIHICTYYFLQAVQLLVGIAPVLVSYHPDES